MKRVERVLCAAVVALDTAAGPMAQLVRDFMKAPEDFAKAIVEVDGY